MPNTPPSEAEPPFDGQVLRLYTAGQTPRSIKAFGCAVLNRDAAQFLQITGLGNAVGSGMTVQMVFTFSQAGGKQYTIGSVAAPVRVPVNVPASPGSRAPAAQPGE